MDEIEIDTVATPSLDSPVLLEGLPGIGLVGKLAADYLVEELDSQPVRRVYSEYFPPAVSVDEDGVASLSSMTIYAVETEGSDLLVVTGDTQANDGPGQYRIADAILDVAAEFDIEEVVGLGGLGTGEQVQEYRVVGATTEGSEQLRDRLEAARVEFGGEPAVENIVGMSGLLVGMGGRRGFQAAGLLGLTSGYHVDPASARAVLEVLQECFEFSIEIEPLNEQAEQVQQMIEQLQNLQQQQQSGQSSEDLRYFD